MSPLRMGSARVATLSIQDLERKVSSLEQAVSLGGHELEPGVAERASAIADKVRARTSLTGGHTVVALAGATGSGKSSLFNRLVGEEVAEIGARRPTTARPTAAIWGPEGPGPLLDWLSVGARHHVAEPSPAARDLPRDDLPRDDLPPVGVLDGLVLLDLPDFDSREISHRAEAERILELVDVFVWVTDPQKYADARLHDDYVVALSHHDAVMLAVLNQADRLTPSAVEQCLADLRRLLALDGVANPRVLATSATTGAGLDELRQRLANAVAGRNAARARLGGDVEAVAARLRDGVGDTEPSLREEDGRTLVQALSRAAGVPTVIRAVERDYRHEALGHTGWPFTRWVRAFRPQPLRRLRLDRDETMEPVSDAELRSVLGRSSLPPPSPAARSAVDLATRHLGDLAGMTLPTPWADAVAAAASPPGPDLADALDVAIVNTPLRDRSPFWWNAVGWLQMVFAFTAILGAVWLFVLGLMGALQLPELDTPRVYGVPYPLLMVVAGLLLGILLAAVSRWFAGVGARRRAAAIGKRLDERIEAVAEERILTPVRSVLDRHARTRRHLEDALS